MQELTNDNYSGIKLYSIFHIELKDIQFTTNTKEPTITCSIRHLKDAASLSFQYGELVNKANSQCGGSCL